MRNIEKLGTEKVSKLLMQYSIPAIIGSLVFAMYNIVDRIYIGQGLGAFAITGVSLTFPIFTIFIAIGMLIGQGGGSLVSIKLGEGKKEEAEKILGNVFTLFTIASIIIMFVSNIFLDDFLRIFGATVNTIEYAREYMKIINYLVFFQFTAMGMNNMIRAEGNAKIAMKTMLIGAIINVILDPIFIFYFKWGISGAAFATAFANIVSAVWVLWHFTKGESVLKLRLKYMKLDFAIVKKIIEIGVSPFSLQITNSLVAVVANKALLLYGGDLAIGAMGIINTIMMFLIMIIAGINAGAQPIIGFNYGAKKFMRVKEALKIAIFVSMLLASVLLIGIMLKADLFINMFNKGDKELTKIGVNGIRIFMSMIVLNAFYTIGANYFQAIGQAMKSVVLNIGRQLLIFIPLLIILPKYLGINGIWISVPISDFIIAILTFFMLKESMKRLTLEEINLTKNID